MTLKLGLLTRNQNSWCSARIRKAMIDHGIEPICFSFSDLIARVGFKPYVSIRNHEDFISEIKGVIVRPIGRGSLDEIIFRLDLLHKLERSGVVIINPPLAIERAVNKYHSLTILEEHGIPIPKTIVSENPDKMLEAFNEIGGDVVLKPIFGSRGMGVCRVSDFEIARRIFNALHYNRNVLYAQEFLPHGNRDIRAFVVDGEVIAAMYRRSDSWKTNISQGAQPISYKPSKDVEDLAIKSTQALGCIVAGVDILETKDGYFVNEINSQPGFRGLQSVTKVDIASKIVECLIKRMKK